MTGLIEQEFNQLIHAVYQGPREVPLWDSFLRLLKTQLKAHYVTLLLRPPNARDQGIVLNAYVSSQANYDAYNQTYYEHDAFVNLPAGEVVSLHDYIDLNTLLASDYYQQYLESTNVYYMLGVDFAISNARLRITRTKESDDFTDHDKSVLAAIAPHLEQSIKLHDSMVQREMECAVFADAIDHLAMGCLLLDAAGQVIRTNAAAENIIDTQPNMQIFEQRLRLDSSESQTQFRGLFNELLQARTSVPFGDELPVMNVRAMRLPALHGGADIGLLMRALARPEASDNSAHPVVAVFISDPGERRDASAAVLKELFLLTPAESGLALLLANGASLDEAAEELGITRNTAKSQLSAIFSKTGVTRQPKLVQLILKSVAPMA